MKANLIYIKTNFEIIPSPTTMLESKGNFEFWIIKIKNEKPYYKN